MAENPLSAGVLITIMTRSLPTSQNSQLRNSYEAVALFSHACMIAVGFRLIGLGEDHKIDSPADSTDQQPLPADWNTSSSYAFRYAHSQSSLEYLLKVNRLGSKAVIFGIGLGDGKTATFDITVKDYISESSFPYDVPTSTEDIAAASTAHKALQDVFISPHRIADLAALFKVSIIQRLSPGIHKPGYEDTASYSSTTPATSASTTRQEPEEGRYNPPPYPDLLPNPARPHPFEDPLAQPRRPPRPPAGDFPPPGFEDEYEITRPPRGYDPGQGDRNPLDIGANDLYPPGLGPHDPLRGSLGPGIGGGGGGAGGGMHPTFEDPLFGRRQGGHPNDGRAPPGARYDPVGPGDEPYGMPGPRFPGGEAGRGGPPNPFGGFGSGDFI